MLVYLNKKITKALNIRMLIIDSYVLEKKLRDVVKLHGGDDYLHKVLFIY